MGTGVTRENMESVIRTCMDFVRSMYGLEKTLQHLNENMSKAEQKQALKEVFDWLTSSPEIPIDSFTKEAAREILAQLTALALYDTYEGSPDTYIV